jgi:indole-3-glycerol phosphate synthase
MSTDFLTQIIKQKGREIAQARKVIPESRLAKLARQRTDFRPFFEPLSRPGDAGVNIIAEIKRASPSKGDIHADLDASKTAAEYEQGGAVAVSVLTDATYFKGHLDDLKAVRSACRLPVLRKEFIISRYQVYEAAAAGADAILLIARILIPEQLDQLYHLCRELGMDALVEIHTSEDARIVAACGARLVGINNRNLSTFETDIAVAMDLVARLAPGQVPVAASGISGPVDIQKNLNAGIFNFLVGESIVRADDPARFIGELMGAASGVSSSSGSPAAPSSGGI